MHTSSYINACTSIAYNSPLTLETPLQGLRVCALTSIENVEASVERIDYPYTSIEQGWIVGIMRNYGEL